MDEKRPPVRSAVSVKEAHAERVARAMRENLKKRKAQARAREAAETVDEKPPRDG